MNKRYLSKNNESCSLEDNSFRLLFCVRYFMKCNKVSMFVKTLYWMFRTVGLNLVFKESNSKLKCNLFYCVPILMHLFVIYRAFVLSFRVKAAGYTVKLALLLIFREILILCIWCSLHHQKKKINKFLMKFLYVSEVLLLQNVRRLYLLFCAALCVIYLYPLIVAISMTGIMTTKEAESYEYIALFGYVTEGATYYIDFLLYCLYNFFLLPLPFLISSVYVFLNTFIYKYMLLCGKCLKKCYNIDKMEKILKNAMQIFRLIEMMEEAFSMCLFFVISLNLTICFTSFAYALGYYAISPSATVGVVAWFTSNAMSFIFIVWTASTVNSESKSLKRSFIAVLARFEKNSMVTFPIIFRLMQFDNVLLTGWQMFDFSRSLILIAAGTILTYGLLILQTRTEITAD